VTLLNPYGLGGEIFFLVLFCLHGALWLTIKVEGELQKRVAPFAAKLWVVLLIVAVLFLTATGWATPLYQNYLKYPILFLILIFTVACLLLVRVGIKKQAWCKAWSASTNKIFAQVFTGKAGFNSSVASFENSSNAVYNKPMRKKFRFIDHKKEGRKLF
jgi:cytochrome d ubiquinol oxidase subunit II